MGNSVVNGDSNRKSKMNKFKGRKTNQWQQQWQQ